MKKAYFIKTLVGWRSWAKLYKLDPPFVVEEDPCEDRYPGTFEFVIVSAVIAPFTGAETLVFPATDEGKPIDMLEIAGSRGTLSHSKVLADMGYKEVSNGDDQVLPLNLFEIYEIAQQDMLKSGFRRVEL